MILDFTQNGLSVVFEIDENKKVALKNFSSQNNIFETERALKWRPALEVHLSGENQDDHHGAKHTGTSSFFHLGMKNINIIKMNMETSWN